MLNMYYMLQSQYSNVFDVIAFAGITAAELVSRWGRREATSMR